ncbi:FMN-linked oxidoreductase [Pholiota conissans]|uniref:FMN-linked oxidoreductase n=1 Tax=Pholiota conissans TaxID=109636 RepID=A0A9P6CT82_9AGAR|nr:FMN-linked oxidoreductase [Pholiota conissans]
MSDSTSTSTPTSTSKLFAPIKIGAHTLQHRVVMAPLTRYKANPKDSVPMLPLVKEYYAQRASCSGTLLITESTLISRAGGGRDNTPGIWSAAQIGAWKEIVDGVHAQGSFIYVQIRAMGRGADPAELEAKGLPFVGPSAIPISGKKTPRPLTIPEIKEYVDWFGKAARNAVEEAGFDGVELHFANGYLVDQFIQDVSNQREDEYGGSVENRSRFALEVVDCVARAIGEEKVGVRLSPWSIFLDMGMKDPIPQFTYLIQALKDQYPDLAFLHLVEPRIAGSGDADKSHAQVPESNDIFRKIWAPKPLITAGGFTRQSAVKRADEEGDLIAFGRLFISNPDLPARLKYDIPLTRPDRKTFYVPGTQEGTEIGYTDYPFAEGLIDVHKP